tara:strand:- start:1900 stop:2307 length:408 start_codon:yes stop_codon:yes gene_type:complete
MTTIPDPVSKEIILKASKDNFFKRAFKDFSKFLIDFNIISYTMAFTIAIATSRFVEDIIHSYLKNYKFNSKLLVSFISLLIIILVCFLFVQLVFYKFIYTKEISKERKIEKAINTKDQEIIDNKIGVEDFYNYNM